MKKGLVLSIILVFTYSLYLVAAVPCSLEVTLLNQDPYPAIPNENVEVVFQMTGVDNPECKDITFQVVQNFPFSVVEGQAIERSIKGNTFVMDYSTHWMIPYTLHIDKNAIDGNSELEIRYYSSSIASLISKKFNINIEDSLGDFEVHVKDYSYSTKELTFEILNIEDVDVEALAVEIPKQENIEIKGSNKIIVGDVDSNEYTTADFQATVKDGNIKVILYYTDQIGVRRTVEKTVYYDSAYFVVDPADLPQTPIWYYVVVVVVVILIIWWIFHKRNKKKQREMRRRGMAKL